MKAEREAEIITEIQEIYNEKLDSLDIKYKQIIIESTFGDTSVIISGNESKSALVVLHAENSAAPFALEVVKGLGDDFKIIAIDIPRTIINATENKSNVNVATTEQWMYEILTWLHVQEITLVGISLGALIIMRYLAFDSQKIDKAILIAPLGITSTNFLAINPSQSTSSTNPNRYSEESIKNTYYHKKDKYILPYLSLLSKLGQLKIPSHEIETKRLHQIQTPIKIITLDNDPLVPYSNLIQQSKKKLLTLQDTLILFHSKHLPDRNHYATIAEFIRKSKDQ